MQTLEFSSDQFGLLIKLVVKILFPSFLLEDLLTTLAWAGMCTLRRCPSNIFSADHGVGNPPSCLEDRFSRVSWRVTCPNHASFRLLEVAGGGSCEPTRRVDLAPHPVAGLVLQEGDAENFSWGQGLEEL